MKEFIEMLFYRYIILIIVLLLLLKFLCLLTLPECNSIGKDFIIIGHLEVSGKSSVIKTSLIYHKLR